MPRKYPEIVLQPNGNFFVNLKRLYAEAFVVDIVSWGVKGLYVVNVKRVP